MDKFVSQSVKSLNFKVD